MKNARNRTLFTALTSAVKTLNVDGEAEQEAGGATGTDSEGRKRAPASNFLPIVRGRLPLLFVHALRFDDVLSKMGTKDAAVKFATSVGKVFDIRKNRNFAYVGADWRPTTDDISAAEAWIAQVGATNAKGVAAAGDKTLMQQTLDAYKARGLASAAEAAAQAAARPKSNFVKAEGTAGGAPKAGKPPKGAKPSTQTGSADDLLG